MWRAEPTSISDCYRNGQVNIPRLNSYQRSAQKQFEKYQVQAQILLKKEAAASLKKRRLITPYRTREPENSLWWDIYILHPECSSPLFQKEFRNAFRLPYASFLEFMEDAKHGNWFPRQNPSRLEINASPGRRSSPIELMILGSLR